jgi:hypothetical protein
VAFLKNVAVRSNDKTYLLPEDEPLDDSAYVLWKDKNYSEELLSALKTAVTGYRHAYAHHNMYKFFKILKSNGLLGYVSMSRPHSDAVLKVEGQIVYVNGEVIYIDEDGFEL